MVVFNQMAFDILVVSSAKYGCKRKKDALIKDIRKYNTIIESIPLIKNNATNEQVVPYNEAIEKRLALYKQLREVVDV